MRISPDQFDDFARHMPGMGSDAASVRRRIETMELLLERAFQIPGTKHRVGLDAIIGLVPVIGDIVTATMGAWMIWEARKLGMSKFQIARMSANVGVDTLLGAVPFVGDAFDLLFRSNTRNLKIIRKHLDKHYPSTVVIDS